jgi:hypothetical protein
VKQPQTAAQECPCPSVGAMLLLPVRTTLVLHTDSLTTEKLRDIVEQMNELTYVRLGVGPSKRCYRLKRCNGLLSQIVRSHLAQNRTY